MWGDLSIKCHRKYTLCSPSLPTISRKLANSFGSTSPGGAGIKPCNEYPPRYAGNSCRILGDRDRRWKRARFTVRNKSLVLTILARCGRDESRWPVNRPSHFSKSVSRCPAERETWPARGKNLRVAPSGAFVKVLVIIFDKWTEWRLGRPAVASRETRSMAFRWFPRVTWAVRN